MGERATVDVFEFTPNGDAVRDSAGPDVSLRGAFTEKVRGGLPFDGRIRGEDHFVDFAGIEQRFEFTCADLFRADAIEWRQMAMQYEVAPAETAGLLDGHHVSG